MELFKKNVNKLLLKKDVAGLMKILKTEIDDKVKIKIIKTLNNIPDENYIAFLIEYYEGGGMYHANDPHVIEEIRKVLNNVKSKNYNLIFKRRLKGYSGCVKTCSFSQDGKIIASGNYFGTITMWDSASEKLIKKVKVDVLDFEAFSPDIKMIASTVRGGVGLWDTSNGKLLKKLKGFSYDGGVDCVAFSSDGKKIAGGGGPELIIWDISSGKPLIKRDNFKNGIRSIAFNPDGDKLAVCECEKIKICDAKTGRTLKILKGQGEGIHSACFSHDGKKIASASYYETIPSCDDIFVNTVEIWDIENGVLLKTKEVGDSINAISFSPDDKTIAVGSSSELEYEYGIVVKIIDWQEMISSQKYIEHNRYPVHSIAFSPEGDKLVFGCGGRLDGENYGDIILVNML